jgi:hypothetical protein
MLFILIPIAWLTVLTLFVCVCRVAADADVDPSTIAATPAGPIGERLVLSRFLPSQGAPPARARRPHARGARLQPGHPAARRSRALTHGIR